MKTDLKFEGCDSNLFQEVVIVHTEKSSLFVGLVAGRDDVAKVDILETLRLANLVICKQMNGVTSAFISLKSELMPRLFNDRGSSVVHT